MPSKHLASYLATFAVFFALFAVIALGFAVGFPRTVSLPDAINISKTIVAALALMAGCEIIMGFLNTNRFAKGFYYILSGSSLAMVLVILARNPCLLQ